jgi:hypothetical protein
MTTVSATTKVGCGPETPEPLTRESGLKDDP